MERDSIGSVVPAGSAFQLFVELGGWCYGVV